MEQAVTEILGDEKRLIFFQQIGELEKVVQNNTLSRKIISNIPASRFDLIKIDQVENDSLLHAFLLQHHLTLPANCAFVGKAIAEQKTVGMISLARMKDTEDYLLQELYVQNGFRRKGIGTQLLNWAMNELKWTGKDACIHLKRVNPSLLQLILKEGKTFKVLGNG
jgi:ribosomal protein S18 acetylase RimI-like enzyme